MQQLIAVAKTISIAAHEAIGQKRRYTGEPYFTHPLRVSEMVERNGGTVAQIVAALLHDVVEDTAITWERLGSTLEMTGVAPSIIHVTMDIVKDLTDTFTPVKGLNRNIRKAADIARALQSPSRGFWLVKHCDVFDNLDSIEEFDPNFLPVFLTDTFVLFENTPRECQETEIYKALKKRYDDFDKVHSFKEHRSTCRLRQDVDAIVRYLPRGFTNSELLNFIRADGLTHVE